MNLKFFIFYFHSIPYKTVYRSILGSTALLLFTVAMLTTASQADTNHSAGIMYPQGVRIVFNDAEFYFNASNGGEITEYYDLLADPPRSRNLANISITGRLMGNLFPLFTSAIYNPYIESDYSTGGDPNASVNLVEKTNESIIVYTTSRMMNRSGLIVTNTAGYPVYINTTWTFDNSTGLIFVERTFSIPTSFNLQSGWRWYPFYFTRNAGFRYNGTFYFFNTTYTKTVISNATSYQNIYNLFPIIPEDNKSIFGVAMPFSNASIEGDGTHNVIITYYYDFLNVSEWKSDTSNILPTYNITEAGAVHEFSEPVNIITHTYRAVVNFTHQQINESNVIGYAKYVDSLYPLVELNLTTDNEVYYPGDAYTISVSGTSQYNLTNLTLKLVATNNSGIYFENEYGSKNYTKGETFSTVLFRGNISNESSGNLTFTAELVSQTGAVEASDSKTVIVTKPQSDGVISGCTVINRPGTYVINHSITNSLVNYCINITSSNVVLDGAGYTINGVNALSAAYGIYVYNSTTHPTNVTVKNLTVMNWGNGIYYKNAANGRIENNTINSSKTGGIILDASSNNVVSSNIVSNSNYGIDISYSNNNTLSGNTASNNSIGILLYSSSNNSVRSNTASNNSQYSIDISYSNNNILSSNTASNNSIGILLYSSSNNTLSGNTANSNSQYGIDISSSSNNNIIYNNFFNNSNNFVISNSISNWNITKTLGMNIIGGFYLGGNVWANSSGNGFSQTCTDSNSDGVCDSSYTLDSNNIDYLPLAYKLIKGDVNGDGKVTITDALFVAQYSAGLRTLTSTQLEAADVNCDGKVTITDALFIAQYTAGLRTTFC